MSPGLRPFCRATLFALLSALPFATVTAEGAGVGTVRVEVLLVARIGGQWRNAEFWPETPDAVPWAGAVPLDADRLPPDGAPALPGLVAPAGFTPGSIDRNQLQLGPDGYTLNRSGRFEPLFHRAWTQPLAALGSESPLYIESKPVAGGTPRVQGMVVVGQAKALQFTLDVLVHDVAVGSLDGGEEQAVPAGAAATEPPAHRTVRFLAKRKLEPGTINYLDHPLFAALVKVDRQ